MIQFVHLHKQALYNRPTELKFRATTKNKETKCLVLQAWKSKTNFRLK